MSSRVNIMEIENFLFTAKVEDLLLVNSSMWRQDDNNDKRRCQQSFNLQKSYFYFNSPSWTMDILNALFLESISLIVLISVHLKHLKKNRITSLMLLHFTISFFQNTHKVTFFVQFSLFKGHGSMVIEVIDNKTGFHFVWCCLCGGWRETAVVTPLQSEEQSRSRSQSRAPPPTGSQGHLSPGWGLSSAWPQWSHHHHYHHHYSETSIGCSLYIQIANERLLRCQIESERRADFSTVI